jgi:hypothetical protein
MSGLTGIKIQPSIPRMRPRRKNRVVFQPQDRELHAPEPITGPEEGFAGPSALLSAEPLFRSRYG